MNLKNKTEMRKELIFYKKNYNNMHTKMIKIIDYIKGYNETQKNPEQYLKAIENIVNEPTDKVYRKYNEFCINNNFTPMGKMEFVKKTNKYFGFEIKRKMLNGKTYKIFV